MKFFKWMLLMLLSGGLIGILLVAALYLYVAPELPSVDKLKEIQLQTPMQVFSEDGELISQFGEKRRIPLSFEQIPDTMVQAFLATEDARFYEHPGIDLVGIVRAFVALVTTGEKKQGASTITMQVARNFFLSREKTYIRKIKEIFLAWHIEQLLTKQEILELYLNKIPLGYRAHGIGAAAEVYYGKAVTELNLAQIAVIAGLPKAPSTLNPIRSPERAQLRRSHVLGRMLEVGAIDQEAFEQADNAPITGRYHGPRTTLYAPYIAEMVRNFMVSRFGEEEAYTGGYRIYTTLSGPQQLAAQTALIENLHDYDMRHGYRGAIKQLWQVQAASDAPMTDEAATAGSTEPQPSGAWSTEKVFDYLDNQSSYGKLVPAVVLAIEEQQADVALKGGHIGTIEWDGLKWARPFISDSRQGKAPKTADQILKPGEHIWVRVLDDGMLQLSQLPAANAAFVALAPQDGAILSLVGGYSFARSQYNRVTQAKRQLGSNIKPFVYSAALDQGYTLASLVNDAPINQWDARQGVAWRPKNSPPIYDGPVRLREALAKSKNVVSVRLLRSIGIDALRSHMNKFGFDLSDLPRNESLALGSATVTPMQVARGFAAFANGGFLVEPYFVKRIEDPQGNILFESTPQTACPECEPLASNQPALDAADTLAGIPEQPSWGICPAQPVDVEHQAPEAVSPQNAFLIRQGMQSAVWGGGSWRHGNGYNGTGWRAARALKRRDIGGKTGTTNEAKDAWFSGYAPGIVATSWIGFDNYDRELGSTVANPNLGKDQITGKEFGAKTAQPAWIRYFKSVLNGVPVQPDRIPEGIVTVRIDRATGKLAQKSDFTSRFEYFESGSQPTEYVSPEVIDIFEQSASDEEDELF